MELPMTSPTSNSDRNVRLRGFTLTELLTVMGIIIILVGILIPTIIRAYSNADRTRIAADIQTLGVALEAYRQDFGDYPRIDRSLGTYGKGTGAAVLCKALVGPAGNTVNLTGTASGPWADAYAASWQNVSTVTYSWGDYVYDSTSTLQIKPTYMCIASSNITGSTALTSVGSWTPFSFLDGLTGVGFKTNRSPGSDTILYSDDDVITGKTWGPYVQLDRFKLQGTAGIDPGMGLADLDNHVFLYYPAAAVKPGVPNPLLATYAAVLAAGGGYCTDYPTVAGKGPPLYCATDNENIMSLTSFQALLGDYSCDGQIEPVTTTAAPFAYAEKSIGFIPYVIVAPGPDGTYGNGSTALPLTTTLAQRDTNWAANKAKVAAWDDVTNFPR